MSCILEKSKIDRLDSEDVMQGIDWSRSLRKSLQFPIAARFFKGSLQWGSVGLERPSNRGHATKINTINASSAIHLSAMGEDSNA